MLTYKDVKSLKCVGCGSVKCTNSNRNKKLIKDHGSLEAAIKIFKCRDCKAGRVPTVKNKKTGKATKKVILLTSKIPCNKCGNKFGTNPARSKKLIATFGSIEEVHAKYVCRSCRKAHNLRADGLVKPAKRTYKKSVTTDWKRDAKGEYVLPQHLQGKNWTNPGPHPTPLTGPGSYESIDVCVYPNQFYAVKCGGCSFEKHCGCRNKDFSKPDAGKKKKGKKIKIKRKKK